MHLALVLLPAVVAAEKLKSQCIVGRIDDYIRVTKLNIYVDGTTTCTKVWNATEWVKDLDCGDGIVSSVEFQPKDNAWLVNASKGNEYELVKLDFQVQRCKTGSNICVSRYSGYAGECSEHERAILSSAGIKVDYTPESFIALAVISLLVIFLL